uniref:(northern house mosquito) hypothetical protein n=1 Tax=Culex pipiens TaxID=7175 RepID=A0A8D8J5D4_CULPI
MLPAVRGRRTGRADFGVLHLRGQADCGAYRTNGGPEEAGGNGRASAAHLRPVFGSAELRGPAAGDDFGERCADASFARQGRGRFDERRRVVQRGRGGMVRAGCDSEGAGSTSEAAAPAGGRS